MTILTDLKCLLCVCVTVKIQFENTSTHEYSSYSPSGLSLYSIARLGPLFRNSGYAPASIKSKVERVSGIRESR